MIDLSTWVSKPDAAHRLGISERTLDRRCDAGEGPERRERPRPGLKPEVVFNPDDVERLAAPKPHVMPAATSKPDLQVQRMPSPESSVSLSSVLLVVDRIASSVESRLAEPAPRPPALYLTLPQASAYTGLSVAFLRRLIAGGKLQSIRDRAVKVRRVDLDNLVIVAELSKSVAK